MRNVLKPISILAAGLLASSAERADKCTPVETTIFEMEHYEGQNYTDELAITTESVTATIADKDSLDVNPDGTIDFSETDRVTGCTRKFKIGQLTSQGMGITVSEMLVGFSGTI